MKALKRMAIFTACMIIFTTSAISQNKDLPAGFLWRISGKGLKKTSYLYGTFHVNDKRLFDFPDSLYTAFENVEAYASELDIDSMMTHFWNKKEDPFDKLFLKTVVNTKDFNRISKDLRIVFHKSPDSVTVKQFRDYFTDFRQFIKEENKTSAAMDFFFYSMARQKGKWVGGIEDLEDQLYYEENRSIGTYIASFAKGQNSMRDFLDTAIDVYRERNLAHFETLNGFVTGFKNDRNIIRRNLKMAQRIDSLAQIRSTFFAIGAGHLIGDTSVINLLRSRGYQLTPVTSEHTIAASTYNFRLKELPWHTIQPDDELYSVQMPGLPNSESRGEIDIKSYIDITTSLVYVTMHVSVPDTMSTSDVLKQAVNNLKKDGVLISDNQLTYDSLTGREIILNAKQQHQRVRLFVFNGTMYTMVLGTELKDSLYSIHANRFFNSLIVNKIIKKDSQKLFTSKQHAFSLEFSSKPSINRGDDSITNIITTNYVAVDTKHNILYQCLVQDLKKGYYLTADSAIFDNQRKEMRKKGAKFSNFRYDSLFHFPAMSANFSVIADKTEYFNRMIKLHRGNRIYTLITLTDDTLKNKESIKSFFQSFNLLPVTQVAWSHYTAPDGSFTIYSPTPIELYTSEEEPADSSDQLYIIHDTVAPASFYIRKFKLNPFYWVPNDSTILRDYINSSLKYNDSMVSCIPTKNGNFNSKEAKVAMFDNHNFKKIRQVLIGDTMVSIYGIASQEMLESENYQKMFSSFIPSVQSASASLYTPKASMLLDSLLASDSITANNARSALTYVKFSGSDLPLLYKAAIRKTNGDLDYNYSSSTIPSLFKIIQSLKDSSTLTFARDQYLSISPEQEDLSFHLLSLIASFKTKESYTLLKDLLIKRTPQKGNPYPFFYQLKTDSLPLTATIMPQLLPLMKDSMLCWQIMALTTTLLDSNFVNKDTVWSYKKTLLTITDNILTKNIKDEDFTPYYYGDLIDLFASIKDVNATQQIKRFQNSKSRELQFRAIQALLKNNQAVNPVTINSLAATNEYRIALYSRLRDLKKISLFPPMYATQQLLSESELYDYMQEDFGEPRKITYIGTRITNYKGTKKKFLLFKIDLVDEDEKPASYLGISGPLNPGAKKPEIYTEETGLYWAEKYNVKKLDEFLQKYLAHQSGEDEEEVIEEIDN